VGHQVITIKTSDVKELGAMAS